MSGLLLHDILRENFSNYLWIWEIGDWVGHYCRWLPRYTRFSGTSYNGGRLYLKCGKDNVRRVRALFVQNLLSYYSPSTFPLHSFNRTTIRSLTSHLNDCYHLTTLLNDYILCCHFPLLVRRSFLNSSKLFVKHFIESQMPAYMASPFC